LAAADVAGGEDSGCRRLVAFVGGDIAAGIELDAEWLDQFIAHRVEESHG